MWKIEKQSSYMHDDLLMMINDNYHLAEVILMAQIMNLVEWDYILGIKNRYLISSCSWKWATTPLQVLKGSFPASSGSMTILAPRQTITASYVPASFPGSFITIEREKILQEKLWLPSSPCSLSIDFFCKYNSLWPKPEVDVSLVRFSHAINSA